MIKGSLGRSWLISLFLFLIDDDSGHRIWSTLSQISAFTGPKETRRKKNALDIHEFFVGGDKKGNLDLEIAHKNDIWLISESRSSLGSPVESERILKKFLPKMAMIWKHSIHPALWTKATFGCLNFFTAGRQSHVGYQHYCRPDGYRCCWCMCCSGRASCRGGEEPHGLCFFAKPFKFNVFLKKHTADIQKTLPKFGVDRRFAENYNRFVIA